MGAEDTRRRLRRASRYAAIKRESFAGADLTSVVMAQLRFDRCDFVRVDLRLATLDGCFFKFFDFSDANFRGASLRSVSFAGCDLTNADLRDCDLRSAQFGSVNTGTDTGHTTLNGANLTDADLQDAIFDKVIGLDS